MGEQERANRSEREMTGLRDRIGGLIVAESWIRDADMARVESDRRREDADKKFADVVKRERTARSEREFRRRASFCYGCCEDKRLLGQRSE